MKQLSLFDFQEETTFHDICASLGCEDNVPAWPDQFGQCISDYLQKSDQPKVKTLSLFSGAGGLDIGFSDVGFDIVESVEIEEKFCETLKMNAGSGKYFEHSRVICKDIREYSGKQLGKIDFMIGGPPCQTFSAAGRRANGVLGIEDERGVLFQEYVRLLKEVSPVGFLFENVYGIIGAQGGRAWGKILESFSNAGYRLFYRIVDAADYGVPQHRERLLIVGLKQGSFKFPRPTHGPDSLDAYPFYYAERAIEGVSLTEEEAASGIGGRYGSLLKDIPPGLNYSFYTEKVGHPTPVFAWRSKFSDFLYKADPMQPVRTIKASGGAYTGPFHWENRFFAYPEYKRLQTFPDNYEISGGKPLAIKQIGNSVPPQLARIMAIAIRIQVFDTSFPFQMSFLEDGEELTFRKRKRELTAVYRKKAERAIASIKQNKTILPVSRTYCCRLGQNFEYEETEQEKAEYQICVIWEKQLTIFVYDANERQEEKRIQISITPNETDWKLVFTQVQIFICSNKVSAFTVGWKALEQELVRNFLKADLVQLNGYYQYKPKLKCTCEFLEDFPYKIPIANVVSGAGVAKLLTAQELTTVWETEETQLYEIAEFFRDLGYEIRNHNTNPQINEGEWLIPYSFPTLTKLSVQLRKRVRG